MNSLDVGCGQNPKGTVNVDLQRGYSDIVCSAEYLPFKDNAFDVVYSSHCLEHVPEPLKALKEFRRVGKTAVLRVPNGEYNRNGWCEDPHHYYTWNSRSLKNFLAQVYNQISVNETVSVSNMKALFFSFVLRKQQELEAVCT